MWRNSVYFAQFAPGLDGRAAIAFLVFIMHWTWWTFTLFLTTCAFFYMIERRGYTMRAAWLRIKRFLTGNMRQKWSSVEYTSRCLPNDIEAP